MVNMSTIVFKEIVARLKLAFAKIFAPERLI